MGVSRRRSVLAWAAAFVIGLVIAFMISRAVGFDQQGFNPNEAALDPDCDQCELTATLDALPYIATGLILYIAIFTGVALLARRRHSSANRKYEVESRR